jgi:phospholipid-transporting ATPase
MDHYFIQYYIHFFEEIVIRERGVDVTYALLAVLEFTNVRRRMSVIVRTPEGQIKLFSKGADLVMFDRMSDGDTNAKEATMRNLREFSREGLRTLVLAQRDVSVEEFAEWKMAFYQANNSIDNREEKVENVCELIETELLLVGCTAIEDKLQEEVPETIHYLLEAGIQLWVLTGDKQETAINIGYSSRLLNPTMELLIVNAENSEVCGEILRAALDKLEDGQHRDVELGMVIDGHSLGFALHDHTEEFLNLGRACRSVICCRVTPLQKALVVRVVKQSEQKVSLAIGDGANDVSMIQEAHVGVGIFGREGTQAARASDYAIHQFRFLRQLLCVHGRYSYIRVAGIIQYSFYKNMCFTLTLLWFSFTNGFTGQTIYDSWIITLYNIIFTSLPPFLYGLFEKDLTEDIIHQHAEVYRRMQKGKLFTKFTFIVWIGNGVWHSLAIYYGCTLLFNDAVLTSSGNAEALWEFGTMAATIVIFVVNLRMALEIKTWNWLTAGGIILSVIVYILFMVIYNTTLAFSTTMEGVFFTILSTPIFYLLLFNLSVLALVPDFASKFFTRQYFPEDWQILREKYGSNFLTNLLFL